MSHGHEQRRAFPQPLKQIQTFRVFGTVEPIATQISEQWVHSLRLRSS